MSAIKSNGSRSGTTTPTLPVLFAAVWLLVLATALILPACENGGGGGESDGDDDGPGGVTDDDDNDAGGLPQECVTDAIEICDYFFVHCEDHGGWPDVGDCYSLLTSGCGDEEGYFRCTCGCLEAADGCDFFQPCEYGCWELNCV